MTDNRKASPRNRTKVVVSINGHGAVAESTAPLLLTRTEAARLGERLLSHLDDELKAMSEEDSGEEAR